MQEMQETRVWSLSWEDLLEEEMETHSSILAWKSPWTEETGGLLQSMGSQRLRHDWACVRACARAHTHTHTHTVMKRMSIYPRSPWQYWGQWVDAADITEWLMDGHGSHHALLLMSHTKAPSLTRRPVSLRPRHPCHWANSSTLHRKLKTLSPKLLATHPGEEIV